MKKTILSILLLGLVTMSPVAAQPNDADVMRGSFNAGRNSANDASTDLSRYNSATSAGDQAAADQAAARASKYADEASKSLDRCEQALNKAVANGSVGPEEEKLMRRYIQEYRDQIDKVVQAVGTPVSHGTFTGDGGNAGDSNFFISPYSQPGGHCNSPCGTPCGGF
jgi:ABC-type transporter Mla subunit MlaD